MAIYFLFAGIAVADYNSSLAWYTRFFGRSPDVIVKENEAMWQITDNGNIYVVGDATRAGKSLLTLMVDDLEIHINDLKEKGIEPTAIETVPELYRKALYTDPEGNMISLGQLSTGT